ncbi:hypothetical protein RHSIM_Rhsim05G0060100 [Rhododendron simsii]|uniref:Jacalin-type lectin domain-containing protein n=1 Tax=Rhododendron simsii TaxID=118357 RepID=A0A834H0J5_RHOSS|nr:hypothetical protein RHSIM_Rhsim05G0060100 [Rhododendron simsii]
MISVDVGVCLASNPRGLEALKRQLGWLLDASSTSLLRRLNMESSFGKVTGDEGWKSLGPWGPRGSQRSRSEASYKADGPVMEMTVHYSQLSPVSDTESIDAISFQSESCEGTLIGCSEIIGSSHGKMTQKSNIKVSGAIPLGPWGGQGGSFWVYKTDVTPIMEITLRYGEIIDSVLFRNYGRPNGDVVGCSDRFGGSGGHNHETV